MREYNDERSHEGLPGMATPASLYESSPRAYPDRPPPVEYGDGWERRHVDANGKLNWRGDTVFLSHALEGQAVGLRDLREGLEGGGRYFAVRFAAVELGQLDADRGRLLRPRERRHLTFPE